MIFLNTGITTCNFWRVVNQKLIIKVEQEHLQKKKMERLLIMVQMEKHQLVRHIQMVVRLITTQVEIQLLIQVLMVLQLLWMDLQDVKNKRVA